MIISGELLAGTDGGDNAGAARADHEPAPERLENAAMRQ
jgi:hypothetical protein